MELTAYVALSYLGAQQRSLDVTAANLANAGTAGFKAGRVLFSDWLSRQNGTDGSHGAAPVAFVQDRATYHDFAPGTLQHTGNPLDLAITGDGYFSVQTPRGPRLTRAGRFAPQADGTIADNAGNALLDKAGQPLRLSPADTAITVASDGSIASENGAIGTVAILRPADPNRMQAEGTTTLNPQGTPTPIDQPTVVQGAVEDSNVQPILEMTRMMSGLRSFEFASQLLQKESDRQQSAIDKITQAKG